MKHRFMVNPFLCVISTLCSALFLLFAIVLLPLARYGSSFVFFLLFLLFAYVAISNGSVLVVDQTALRVVTLGIPVKELLWSDISEIGVCGTKVFNQSKPDKTGTLYFYFSQDVLDDEKRFEMVLKWPPRQALYCVFSQHSLVAIQSLWRHHIVMYNTGDKLKL